MSARRFTLHIVSPRYVPFSCCAVCAPLPDDPGTRRGKRADAQWSYSVPGKTATTARLCRHKIRV